MGFFSSLFSSSSASPEEEKARKDEQNFDVLKYDGIRAAKIGQLKYAAKCFENALELRNDFETKGHLVGIYTAMDRPEDALSLVSEMVNEEPTHTDTRFVKIDLLLVLDRYQEVVEECEAVLSANQSNAEALYKMARAKKGLSDALGSLTAVSKSLSINPENAEAYRLRAQLLDDMNQTSDAIEDMDKAIEYKRDEDLYFVERGNLYAKKGNFDKAEADYDKAIELNPFCDKANVAKGSLLIAQGKMDEAISYFDSLISENEEMAEAYSERGRAKRLKGDNAGAMDDLKKSLELAPEGEIAKKLEGQHNNFDDMYKGGIF
jgi:tetratricopeptide (TPR) repeat protein